MNRISLYLFVLLALCVSTTFTLDISKYNDVQITEEDIEELFGLYIMHRAPLRLEPSVERYNYFKSQVLEIIAHNKNPNKTWKRTITKFTGLTLKELEGFAIMASQNCSATNRISAKGNLKDLPDYVDWREAGVVTPVKDQGKCGSCWTFSTVGAVEAHWAIYKGSPSPLLSEQQLVDCAGDYNNHGCSGGLPSQAFQYIQAAGGLQTEVDYPYKAVDGTCYFDGGKVAASVYYGSANITEGDEQAIMETVANVGPVSIAYQVTADFKDYAGGVYVGETCKASPETVNHAVLAVGYGYDAHSKLNYWIVKNSWTNAWGEEGYFRIKRGVNMCGLAVCASYPQIKNPN